MGKSPAKWIKTVLFGKKSSRSHSSKGRDASKAVDPKEWAEGKGLPASTVDSSVISQTLPVNAARNDLMAQKGALPSLTTDGVVASSINQDAVIVASAGSGTPEKIREEQAAVKAQAAFRGYLARRAFRALRGIIRLQALIRGHLVRRQAVATLRCMQGIVELQALVRGRRVRLSDIGSEAYEKSPRAKFLGTKQVSHFGVNISTQKTRCSEASTNAFVCKLLSSKPAALPLQMHYVQEEPNSVWNWLERWTCSRFWKPHPQPKKTADLKSQTRNGGYAMETESGRSKRTVRRNFSANTDFGTTNNTAKRNFKKFVNSPTELVQEHPQSELEKVKRNLRKISNSMAQPSDQAEIEIEKPKHSARRTSNLATDVSEIEVVDSAEKIKKNNVLLAADAKPEIENYSKLASVAKPHVEMTLEPSTESELHIETTLKAFPETKQNMNAGTEQLEADMPVNASTGDNVATELQPVYGFAKDNLHTPLNVEKTSNEEQSFHENQKTSKRRASLSAKTEFNEDGLQNTPTLPSYMAATQSAKAKLRGLSSPRFSADGIEKNDFTRRHSLPSSTNGKLSTLSSQTQRQVQTNGRGGIRNDRSCGHGKPIQVEWRR